eukprot:scaffold1328_cov394-Prasinococcus_capsulatus_cf.AAC.12
MSPSPRKYLSSRPWSWTDNILPGHWHLRTAACSQQVSLQAVRTDIAPEVPLTTSGIVAGVESLAGILSHQGG